MSEQTRGWIYRLAVLALVVYVAIERPDHFIEWVPVILGLPNILSSVHTTIRSKP